jgi:hypothetical protein
VTLLLLLAPIWVPPLVVAFQAAELPPQIQAASPWVVVAFLLGKDLIRAFRRPTTSQESKALIEALHGLTKQLTAITDDTRETRAAILDRDPDSGISHVGAVRDLHTVLLVRNRLGTGYTSRHHEDMQAVVDALTESNDVVAAAIARSTKHEEQVMPELLAVLQGLTVKLGPPRR